LLYSRWGGFLLFIPFSRCLSSLQLDKKLNLAVITIFAFNFSCLVMLSVLAYLFENAMGDRWYIGYDPTASVALVAVKAFFGYAGCFFYSSISWSLVNSFLLYLLLRKKMNSRNELLNSPISLLWQILCTAELSHSAIHDGYLGGGQGAAGPVHAVGREPCPGPVTLVLHALLRLF
jgi:hypothetical protein